MVFHSDLNLFSFYTILEEEGKTSPASREVFGFLLKNFPDIQFVQITVIARLTQKNPSKGFEMGKRII